MRIFAGKPLIFIMLNNESSAPTFGHWLPSEKGIVDFVIHDKGTH
jgi:hypothetical protein